MILGDVTMCTLLVLSGEVLEALGAQGHQLGNRGDVPVGVGDLGVAEVGRECQDPMIDVDAVLVPAQEPANGERVAQIVYARSASAALCCPTEAISEPAEGLLDSCQRERRCAIRAEEMHPERGALHGRRRVGRRSG